jgi:transposase
MGRQKRYHPEFQAQAVELVRSSGKSIRQVSEELGVPRTVLGNWVRQAPSGAGVEEQLAAEVQRLRRENTVLREERDILKKAMAFFAREESRK